MSLERFLEALADPSTTVALSDFVEVSDLLPGELGLFARAWFGISAERQRWVISSMVELAEDTPELDFGAVFKMCLKDKDEVVLEKAMEGLWEHEERSIIPSLIQILHSDKGPRVRAAAAVALGKFPVLVQEGKLLAKDGDSIYDGLMKILNDPNQPLEVQRRSLEAVAPFNTSDIRRLVSWAYESEDLKLKSSSIYAMGRTGEINFLPLLIKELQNQEADVRYETAHACGELGEEDAVPHLIPLLADDDYQVQLAGITAMGKIGGPLAKKVLVNCVKEGDATLEEVARAELQNIEFLEDPMAFTSEV
jgi:HEAT repeat protein